MGGGGQEGLRTGGDGEESGGARAGRRGQYTGPWEGTQGHRGVEALSTGGGRRQERKGCADGEEGRKRRRERGRARERRSERAQGSRYAGPTQKRVPWGPVGCQGSHCTHGRVDGHVDGGEDSQGISRAARAAWDARHAHTTSPSAGPREV